MGSNLPHHTQVVIIGGGIVGCSIAYHLTKLGWRDVVLLEQGKLTNGTTWHAAGLVTQFRNSRTMIELNKYGLNLYPRLEAETGQPTGFKQPGSITVARNEGRMDELRKIASLARAYGIECEPISPQDAGQMWPLMRTDDLMGAIHIPKDGETTPELTAMAMAIGAAQGGAFIVEDVSVTGVSQNNSSVTGISTNQGSISCEIVVNCAGMWAREIGQMCGVKVPLHAAEHMYLVTKPMEGVTQNLRSLRDPDEQIYFRHDIENKGALLMGGFESVAKPWGMDGIPKNYRFSLLTPDWEHFKIFWENAIHRVPTMELAGIDRFYVSAESFTPDNRYIMGEAPELRNFYVAAGMNSSGIGAGAGVGKAMAEWIVEGHPTMDLAEVDIKRFHDFQNNPRYLYDRTVESVGLMYGMHWPQFQNETARLTRRSPLHERLLSQRACFGTVTGWERANWFAPPGIEPKYEYSYGRQNWFNYSAEEHIAVRTTVGLFDQTSFAKFLLQGKDAEAVLQQICAGNVAVPVGTVVYTALLNDMGGMEADITATRTSSNTYLIITSAAASTRDFHWIQSHIPKDTYATLTDITSAYAVLGLMGPHSRDLLKQLSDMDFSNEAFPYMTSREIPLAYATVRATRITYVGELGWELYIPTEFAVSVYDSIVREGVRHGLRHAGYHAMDSLRIEKAYRAWGLDMTDQDTALEAGLGFVVDFNKESSFIGKSALISQRQGVLTKRLAVFTVDDPEPMFLGDEPIYRDGILVGRTTSGAYGHTVGRSVGMGYVENNGGVSREFVLSGSYEVEILARRFSVKASLRAPYDPEGKSVRM